MLQKIINNFTKLITKEKAKEKTNVFLKFVVTKK